MGLRSWWPRLCFAWDSNCTPPNSIIGFSNILIKKNAETDVAIPARGVAA